MKKTIMTIVSSTLVAIGGATLVFLVGIEKKDEEIATLSSKVQELSEDIEVMSELNDSNQAKLSKRNNTIAELEKRIENLEKESTKLKGNVSQKEGRIKELTNEIERRKKNEAELSKRVSIKEAQDKKKAERASSKANLKTVAAKTPAKPKQESSSPKGKTMTMEATAYGPDCYGCSGITANGTDIRNGNIYVDGHRVIAADPQVIPMNSIVKITYSSGKTETAKVCDTGGRIKGNIIDIAFASEAETPAFGRQQVQVELVK